MIRTALFLWWWVGHKTVRNRKRCGGPTDVCRGVRWACPSRQERSGSHFDALKNSMIFLCSSAVSEQRTRMWCIATSHSRRV